MKYSGSCWGYIIIAGCFLLMVYYVAYLTMDSAPVNEDILAFKGRTLLADGGPLVRVPPKSRIGSLNRYRFKQRVISPGTLKPALGPLEGLLVRQDLEHQQNIHVLSSGILYVNDQNSTLIRDNVMSRVKPTKRYRFHPTVRPTQGIPVKSIINQVSGHHQLGKDIQVSSSGILYANDRNITLIRDSVMSRVKPTKRYRFHPTVRPTQGIPVQSVVKQVSGHHQPGKDLSESLYASSPTSISTKSKYLYHRNAEVCPIRNIIKRLHEPNTSAVTVNSAIKDLSHCKTIYFTSVQKCSTQTIFKLFQSLESTNHFQTVSWLHKVYPLPWSREFFHDVTNRPLPSLHRREARYENFSKSGFPLPVYLSMVRHPVDRLVSLYYFRIFGSGDNTWQQKQMLAKWNHCRNTSLDDIVDSIRESNMVNVRTLLYSDKQIHRCWPGLALQQNFFCDGNCRIHHHSNRVKMAMRTVISEYLLVGTSEDLGLYMQCIQRLMPKFFKGIFDNYQNSKSLLWSKFKTSTKRKLKPRTHSKLEQLLKTDIQFYEQVRQRFHTLCQ